jgi:hypothetical protein
MQVHITSINTSVHKEGFKIDFILSSQSKLLTGCSESGYSTSDESDAGSVPRRDSARRVFMLPDRLFSLRRIFCSDSSGQPVHFHRNVQALSLANDLSSLPVAFDLYLPEEWANDPVRRAKAGVPKNLSFRTKPQIALEQIRRALADGLPPGVVLGGSG